MSSFFIGDMLGYVIMEDLPVTDLEIENILNDEDTIRVIISKKEPARKAMVASAKSNLREAIGSSIDTIIIDDELNMAVAEISREEYEELKKNRALKNIRIDEKVSINLQTSTQLINSATSNNLMINGENLTGKGITVCVIDTGINYNHPDLGGCTTSQFNQGQCSKVIGGTNIINTTADPKDDNGHGTHVAGIIAAKGIARGVAPDAKLVAVKALDKDGAGYTSYLTLGIQWCTNNKDTYNISVISISAGGITTYSNYCDSADTQGATAVNNAINSGISVVVATGNDGRYTGVNFPACLSNAIPVTSVQGNTSYATSANRGVNFPNLIAAPGVSIISTYNQGHAQLSGTSMATPHVSGVIALYQQMNQGVNGNKLNDEEVKTMLKAHGFNLYDSQTNKNYPYLQSYNALLSIDNTVPHIELNVTPITINLSNPKSIQINWSSHSNHNFNTTLLVQNQSNTLFTSTNKTGSINYNLTNTGKYNISINSQNTHGLNNFNREVFVKDTPSFNININNLTSKLGYIGQYNISVNLTKGTLENISLLINNNMINLTDAQNITLTNTNYSIITTHQETENYFGFNTTTNLTILNPHPKIINTTSNESNISIYEDEIIIFNQESFNPLNDELIISWTEKENENENENETITYNNSYTFIAKNKTYVNLTLIVKNSEGNDSKQWNINILARPLNITRNLEKQQTLEYNDQVNFTINATDIFNRTIKYNWSIKLSNQEIIYLESNDNNDNPNDNPNNTYLFNASNYTQGNYELIVHATNDLIIENISWNITIMPKPYIIVTNNIPNLTFYTNENKIIYLDNYFDFYFGELIPLIVLNFDTNNLSNESNMNHYLIANYTVINNSNNNNNNNNNNNHTIILRSEYENQYNISLTLLIEDDEVQSNYFIANVVVNPSSSPSLPTTSGAGGASTGGGGGSIGAGGSGSSNTNTEENNTYDLNKIKNISIKFSDDNLNSLLRENIKIKLIDTPDLYDLQDSIIPSFVGKIYQIYEIKIDAHNNLNNANITNEANPINTNNANYNNYSNQNNEETIIIEFKVNKTWLNLEGLIPEQIALHRYTNQWIELSTTIKEITPDEVIFESNTPGFSYFVIGTKQQVNLEIEQPLELHNNNNVNNSNNNQDSEQEHNSKENSLIFIILTVSILIIIGFYVRLWRKHHHLHNKLPPPKKF